MTPEHSKTPWKRHRNLLYIGPDDSLTPPGPTVSIASIRGGDESCDEANAAFICTAVNAHAGLARLRTAVEAQVALIDKCVDDGVNRTAELWKSGDAVRAALASLELKP